MNVSLEEATMAKTAIRYCQETVALVVLVTFVCFGLSSGGALAQKGQKGKAVEDTLEAFDHKNFDNSANVDNKWFPLQPGTQLIYKGFTQEDEKRVPARVVQTVTDLTKVVNGVRTVVVWDVDYKDGKVAESEIVFFAQDKDGNVWLMGELVEIYEDGDFKGGSAWIGGMDGSSSGNHDEGRPAAGDTQLLSGLCATSVQLDRPCDGRKSRSEGLCPGRLLQGCSGDRGGQQG